MEGRDEASISGDAAAIREIGSVFYGTNQPTRKENQCTVYHYNNILSGEMGERSTRCKLHRCDDNKVPVSQRCYLLWFSKDINEVLGESFHQSHCQCIDRGA